MRETEVPAIPAISEETLVDAITAVKNTLDVREGRLGDPLDQAVTLRDLQALGIVTPSNAGTDRATVGGAGTLPVVGTLFNPTQGYNEATDLTTPPQPQNLIATGLYSSISLSWSGNNYKNHAYTEVWRSGVDNLGTAVLVGTTIGNLYDDPVGTEKVYYYWIRFVSIANVTGAYNLTSGTKAETAVDVVRRLETVRQEILNNPLTIELGTRINRLETVQGLNPLAPLTPLTLKDYIPPSIQRELDAIKTTFGQRIGKDPAPRIANLDGRVRAAETSIVQQAANLTSEASTRAAAIQNEADARAQAILNEASARATGDSALQSQINTIVAAGSSDTATILAALQTEQTARISADSAEATARETLATQIRGSYAGNDPSMLSTGILYNERQARITSEGVITSNVSALSATVTNNYNTLSASVTSEQSARISGDETITTNLTALTSRVSGAESNITTLQTTTATQATSISSLTTRVGTAESNITSIQNTNADQTTSINALSTRVGTAESSITTLQNTTAGQATSLSSLTTRVGSAESNITTLQNTTASQATSISSLSTRVGSAESSITSLQNTTASQATSISSLTTRIGSAESSITTLQNTTSTQATQISSLSTSVGQKARVFAQNTAPESSGSYTLATNDIWYDLANGAKMMRWNGSAWVEATDTRLLTAGSDITTLYSTTASQATSINSLATRTAAAESSISSLQTTSATQASSISSLTTRVGASETSITNLQTTTANQATSISQLSSTVGGHTTSIQTLSSTTDGLSGQYGVKIDNNGHISGFGLLSTTVNGTPSSAFIIRADKFAIVDPASTANNLTNTPSSAAVPFAVIDGSVYIKAAFIQDATITSAKIQSLAADKISAGTISAAVDMQSPTVRSGPIAFGAAGFFLGEEGGVRKFYVGNGTTGASGRSLSFNGTDVEVRGTIYAYAGVINNVTANNITIYDNFGRVVLSSGGLNTSLISLSSSQVSGLGALASQNSVTSGQVTGLGTLATQNSVTTGQVSGLGALATQDNVSTGQVTGLGTLATQNSVSSSQVSGLGSLATANEVYVGSNVKIWNGSAYTTLNAADFVNKLSKITSGNIGTFIEGAAIGSAYIGTLTAANLNVTAISDTINGGATSGGRVTIQSNKILVYDENSALRVKIGNLA